MKDRRCPGIRIKDFCEIGYSLTKATFCSWQASTLLTREVIFTVTAFFAATARLTSTRIAPSKGRWPGRTRSIKGMAQHVTIVGIIVVRALVQKGCWDIMMLQLFVRRRGLTAEHTIGPSSNQSWKKANGWDREFHDGFWWWRMTTRRCICQLTIYLVVLYANCKLCAEWGCSLIVSRLWYRRKTSLARILSDTSESWSKIYSISSCWRGKRYLSNDSVTFIPSNR